MRTWDKVFVVWLSIVSAILLIAIGVQMYDMMQWKAERGRMSKAFWEGDSIRKAQQLQWEQEK